MYKKLIDYQECSSHKPKALTIQSFFVLGAS